MENKSSEVQQEEIPLDNVNINVNFESNAQIADKGHLESCEAPGDESAPPTVSETTDNFASGLVEQVQSEEDSSQSIEATDEEEGPNYVYIKGTASEPSSSTSSGSVAKVEVGEKHAEGAVEADQVEIAQETTPEKAYGEMMQIGDVEFKQGVHYVVNEEQLHRSEDGEEEIVVLQGYETTDDGTTIVHIGEDGGSYYIEEMVDNPGEVPTDEDHQQQKTESITLKKGDQPPKKRKGRKPGDHIPLHVLGRDISAPVDPIPNGKSAPKPRLGVKVPYRNLTSQIVSKEDIQKEIMERSRMKEEKIARSKGEVMFARRLTQRLAMKLGANKKPEIGEEPEQEANPEEEVAKPKSISNSDLLAILAGEDSTEEPMDKDKRERKMQEQQKLKEKEIALQQLEELPTLAPKRMLYKGRQYENLTDEQLAEEIAKAQGQSSGPTAAVAAVGGEEGAASPMRHNLKETVVKTYSRKRKPSYSTDEFLEDLPEEEKDIKPVIKEDTYVTKSSRVIKKKVIWDPAEATPKKRNVDLVGPIMEKIQSGLKAVKKNADTKNDSLSVKKQSPSTKCKKRLTEVDKLLMDEGAINMIYDVTTNSEETDVTKKKKNIISLDKAHKELMKKSSEIKNEFQQNISPKSLRKTQIAQKQQRKPSKDSQKSTDAPPASPFSSSGETSRIIRRRSSSSFSSNAESDTEDKSQKKRIKKDVESNGKEEEVGKPAKEDKRSSKAFENRFGHFKNLTVKKTGKEVHLSLQGQYYLTVSVLKELTTSLKLLAKEKDCNVVVMESEGKTFCLGLDYSSLVCDKEDERKKRAIELANQAKDYLKCLLTFPKVLVAAIEGECQGLGVTMLPLFDIVVASDTATFCTPYAKLGCISEAGFLLRAPYSNNNGLASELLFSDQKIKADDAFRKGFVTKLFWPEKYRDELKNLLASIAKGSRQSLEAIKSQLQQNHEEEMSLLISHEAKQWMEYWLSTECQKNFAQLVDSTNNN